MQAELLLEIEQLHPRACPCKACELEMEREGAKRGNRTPDWVLKITHPGLLEQFQQLRDA